jgi:hypothetical protein
MIYCKSNVKVYLQEDKYNVERDLCGVFIVVNIPYQGQRESLFNLKIRNRLCSIKMRASGGGEEVKHSITYNMKNYCIQFKHC